MDARAADRAVRVLHVIPAVAERYGGPSRAVREMCAALIRRPGLRVQCATTDADGPHRLDVPLGDATQYGGLPAIFFKKTCSEGFKYSSGLRAWLDAHVADFDVVHIHAVFSHSSLAAAAACRRAGRPYVLRPLGSLDPWSLRRRRLEKNVLWHLGVAQLLRQAAAVHYTSDMEHRLAERLPGIAPGRVIPLGVSEEVFSFSRNARLETDSSAAADPYVLVLGRLDPKKGIPLLIPAFLDALKSRHPGNWRLVIAGEGSPQYVRRLRHLAARQGGANKIVFCGWLSGSERLRALNNASLLAMPSYQENFGLSAAEAMACGVPVLVSDRVNLAPLVRQHRAGWVARLERNAWGSALGEAMRDSGERGRRGQNGRRLASQVFRWKVIAREIESLYHHVLSDHLKTDLRRPGRVWVQRERKPSTWQPSIHACQGLS